MNGSWWKSRKVFLTGHTGFKGSWLCMMLEHFGAEVHGYALSPPTEPNLFTLAGVGGHVRNTLGDVRDLARLTAAVRDAGAEIVIHMAAQPLVRESYTDPAGTFSTNVMGTVNLLDAVRTAGRGVRAVLVVTTDKCYENREWVWGYREDEPMGGHDPYSSSKGCAELVTSAYRRSYFSDGPTAVGSARAGNVIGGGDWAKERLVPDIVQAFVAGRTAIIRNPHAIRPWQHVLEPLAGYLTLAEHLVNKGHAFASGWNFGPGDGDERAVEWIVKHMVELWGETAKWELAKGEHPHEASYLKLDTSKAAARLGWKPRTDLSTALKWTVEWYKEWKRGGDVRKMSMLLIKRFLELSGS